jgi:hypothetical protein
MDKMLVAQGVANRLFATEVAIDKAMVEASLLMSDMLTARQDLRVAATVGGEAATKVAAAMAAMAEARAAVVAAHAELNDAKGRVGIRTKMIGEWPKPPAGAPLSGRDQQIVNG